LRLLTPFTELPVLDLVLVSSFFFLLNIRDSYSILLKVMQNHFKKSQPCRPGVLRRGGMVRLGLSGSCVGARTDRDMITNYSPPV
jgi:hypothetical protein